MSWLSELFGGGGGEDPLAVQQRMETQRRNEAVKAAADAEAARRHQQDLFSQQMEMLRASLTPAAPAPDPEIERQRQREELRSGALSQINAVFAPEFEQAYAPANLVDPLAASTYTSQRGKADEYLRNLLKRNVITETGYKGGQAALEEQAPRVRSQLSDIGNLLLEQERSKLRDIAGRGREAASTIDIGQTFDPNSFANLLTQESSTFQRGLADKYAAQIPGDLFDVGSLASRAGAAQGAQNLKFDPAAIAGAAPEEPDPFATAPKKKPETSLF